MGLKPNFEIQTYFKVLKLGKKRELHHNFIILFWFKPDILNIKNLLEFPASEQQKELLKTTENKIRFKKDDF